MQARIWNDSTWITITNPQTLSETFGRLLKDSGFKVLNVLQHHFEPQGYTALYLLAESHLAIHTFPEFGKTYVEISSCNMENFVKFVELTKGLE